MVGDVIGCPILIVADTRFLPGCLDLADERLDVGRVVDGQDDGRTPMVGFRLALDGRQGLGDIDARTEGEDVGGLDIDLEFYGHEAEPVAERLAVCVITIDECSTLCLCRAEETEQGLALGGITLGEEEGIGRVGIDSLKLIACHRGHDDRYTTCVGGAECHTGIVDVVRSDDKMAGVSASFREAE